MVVCINVNAIALVYTAAPLEIVDPIFAIIAVFVHHCHHCLLSLSPALILFRHRSVQVTKLNKQSSFSALQTKRYYMSLNRYFLLCADDIVANHFALTLVVVGHCGAVAAVVCHINVDAATDAAFNVTICTLAKLEIISRDSCLPKIVVIRNIHPIRALL